MKVPRYVRQILKPPTLDIESAISDAVHVIVAPRKVYRAIYYRQQSKNSWARDDPSFVLVVVVLIAISSFFWGLLLHSSFLGAIGFTLYSIVVDFLALGSLVAYCTFALTNKFLVKQGRPDGKVELSYCFDIHCYSYLAIWLYLHVVQLVLMPVLTMSSIGLVLGNILYTAAFTHYLVITFLGFSAMSFVEFPQLYLLPVIVITMVSVLCTVCRFSIVRFMLTQYLN